MANQVTKKDFEEILDKKLGEYQEVILDAVSTRFDQVDVGFAGVAGRFDRVEKRLDKIEKTIQSLANTLDQFLKRLTAHEEEFEILKAEMTQVKKVLKQKLGVEISLQGK